MPAKKQKTDVNGETFQKLLDKMGFSTYSTPSTDDEGETKTLRTFVEDLGADDRRELLNAVMAELKESKKGKELVNEIVFDVVDLDGLAGTAFGRLEDANDCEVINRMPEDLKRGLVDFIRTDKQFKKDFDSSVVEEFITDGWSDTAAGLAANELAEDADRLIDLVAAAIPVIIKKGK
jgi:hypothetical protein